MDQRPSPGNVAFIALLVEGGLGLLAVALGWALDRPPGDSVVWEFAGLGWGLAATVPLIAVMVGSIWAPWRPFRQLQQIVDQAVVPLFGQSRTIDLFLIAALAGFGEEMLFRGVLQPTIASWFEPPGDVWIGAAAAAALFGIAHGMTRIYALLATLIGFYLGGLMLATGNLLVPIVAHALYDFVALVYFTRFRRPAAAPSEPSP